MVHKEEIRELTNQLKAMINQYEVFMQKSLPQIDRYQLQIKIKSTQPDQDQTSYATIVQELAAIEAESDKQAKAIKNTYARLAWLKRKKADE